MATTAPTTSAIGRPREPAAPSGTVDAGFSSLVVVASSVDVRVSSVQQGDQH